MVEFIMDQFTKGDTEEEYHENMSKRIDLLLQIAGEIKYEDYLTAIKGTRKFGLIIIIQSGHYHGMQTMIFSRYWTILQQ